MTPTSICLGCNNIVNCDSGCEPCRHAREVKRYMAKPESVWDGKAMLYSNSADRFFNGLEEAQEYIEGYSAMDGELLAGLMLVICVPVYASIDIDQFHDILPDEDYGHDELESAIETFNSTMSSIILSWIPGGFRLKGV